MGAVGVEGAGQAPGRQHGAQRGHDGDRTLAPRTELGVEHLRGGVVDHGEEGQPLLGHQGEPLMPTAIEVEQLAEAGAGRAPAAVAAPGPMLGHQARALQRLLHKRVAEGDAVVAAGLAQEVPDVEALVVRPIEVQHPLDFGNRRALGRRRLTAPIHQPVIAVVLVAPPQPSNTPRAPAEDVGSLEPRQLPTERSQDDLLDLHGALHGADGVGHGHLLGDQFSPDACLERSFHVALGSGQIMCSLQS